MCGGQFDSVLVDYLHKRKFPVIGPLMTWLLRGATVATLVGVYQFNTNDVGASPFPLVFSLIMIADEGMQVSRSS